MCLQFQGLQAFDLGAIALRCQSLTEPSAYKEIPWGGEKGRQLPSSPHWTESPSFNPFMPVLVSDCCCNKLPQIQWLKTIQMYCLTVWRSESKMGWQGCALSGGCRGQPVPCPLQSPEPTHILCSWPPFPLQGQQHSLFKSLSPCCSPSVMSLPLSVVSSCSVSSYKDPDDCMGLIQVLQGQVPTRSWP